MTRRPMFGGRPLLAASAGLVLTIGCGNRNAPPSVGNLMAPPDRPNEICVDPTPADATVSIAGRVTTDRCTVVTTEGPIRVEVSAPGYTTETLEVMPDGAEPITVTLVPAGLPPDILEPVGNLMAPQPLE